MGGPLHKMSRALWTSSAPGSCHGEMDCTIPVEKQQYEYVFGYPEHFDTPPTAEMGTSARFSQPPSSDTPGPCNYNTGSYRPKRIASAAFGNSPRSLGYYTGNPGPGQYETRSFISRPSTESWSASQKLQLSSAA